ncbi:MAG: SUF system NifU family Fe-S cluster assembly protein [candidate division KSB1 bacterium]|nr:SUF system NifU family Fe-S cluster assembly protein [candidate division KSB1 bacterium]MDZ7368608.1 SUF system NifU family Fe-S cluster assembly protein [candidate division KSB1 bacterium]MDZ7406356.1 SUF system NifU family Fe-S cluster assembly protein [candidate division KSB1 bacterium]
MPLDALYQKIILDHFKNPRNFGKIKGAATRVHHENPSCGDQLDLQVVIDEHQHIDKIKFYGRGCAISQASASMMTELVQGQTVAEARAAIASFMHMLTGNDEAKVTLGDLAALGGVKQFPLRVKCATLAWKALESCLQHAEVQP